MMKTAILTQSFVAVIVLMIGTSSFAGQYDNLLYFANHRDTNGNLVVPQNQKSPQVESVPNVKTTMPSPTPLTPHPVSHVQTVTEVPRAEVLPQSQHEKELQPSSEMEVTSNTGRPDVVQSAVGLDQTKSYVVRQTNWGMSIPEVKTKETADFSWELDAPVLLDGEHRLGYQTQVEGIEAFLAYTFEHDRLRSAKYLFETGYIENEGQPLLHYKTVKAWIMQAYGPPHSEAKLWVNELYRYAPELWGRALMRGHLTFVDEWTVEDTTITLVLNGGDEDIGLMAEFMTNHLTQPRELASLSSSDVVF